MISEVYNEDCIEGMKRYPDNYFDLAIVNPPYGLGNRLSDGGGKLKNTPMATLYREKDWDILPTAEYWQELFRVSKNQVVFGANYLNVGCTAINNAIKGRSSKCMGYTIKYQNQL